MSEQREALAETVAHADHCHGLVTRDGIEGACGKPPVAIIDGRGTEDEGYWPACAYHAHRYGRGNVVPLARLLADAEQRVAAAFRIAAELTVQDVRAQRGDHIASIVEDSFAAHFDRAALTTGQPTACGLRRATVAEQVLEVADGFEQWRDNREPGWCEDIGYAFENALRGHRYAYDRKGIKPDDPGWHECSCGNWQGYWSGFEPHVAAHLRALVISTGQDADQ